MLRARGRRACACTLVLLSAFQAQGCGVSTRAHWRAGYAPLSFEDRRPPRKAEDVRVYYRRSFGPLEERSAKRRFACDSVTLLRRSELVPGKSQDAEAPPDRPRIRLAEVTTEELPRDEERSRLEGDRVRRVLGLGRDEPELFTVVPEEASIERGARRLRELGAALGADAVEDVFMTVYAEHQMWEGSAISFDPRSTRSPIYVSAHLLNLKLRDVRFHGIAVVYED